MAMYLQTSKFYYQAKAWQAQLNYHGINHQPDLNHWTLEDNIFKRNHCKVTPTTYKKLSDWFIDEDATADIKDNNSTR